MRIGLDLAEQATRFHHRDDFRARLEAVAPFQRREGLGQDRARINSLVELAVALQRDAPFQIEHIDDPQPMPLADLEIVEVVRRRDLHRARALFRVGVFVGDDRDAPPDERQDRKAPDQALELLVLGMHGDARVAEHRLGAGRRDGDHGAVVALERIIEIIKVPVRVLVEDLGERCCVERLFATALPFEGAAAFDLLHLQVGDRRVELRVPIDEALVLIDEPRAIELDEDLHHGARQALVEREALPRPVAGGAEALQLLDDRAAQFRLPGPDALQKFLAAQVAAARLLPLHELALDDHLRRDASVVRARLPEHVATLHARVPGQNILQRVVERMAHMQIAGDVRRRNDDGVGGGCGALGPAGAKGARVFPIFSDAPLDGGGVEGLVHRDAFEASCRLGGFAGSRAGARYCHALRAKSNAPTSSRRGRRPESAGGSFAAARRGAPGDFAFSMRL